ncbi:DNA helicase MCM9-like protein [Dinothrombium tinctorium]|uniref:DNA helicase MCM9-like protein n=1 Tax=Dinothrombium tinctorium TaxID=1965070 RepID=A0A443QS62_9ACAR|nr:DNA helicase MCM9-like protein [Dinothrombium tinctorium]
MNGGNSMQLFLNELKSATIDYFRKHHKSDIERLQFQTDSLKPSQKSIESSFESNDLKDYVLTQRALSKSNGENERSQRIEAIALQQISHSPHNSITTQFSLFVDCCPQVANVLLSVDPIAALKHLDAALCEAIGVMAFPTVHVRPIGLPLLSLVDCRNEFPLGHNSQRQKLLSISGIVLKMDKTGWIEYYREYKCKNCSEINIKETELSDVEGNAFQIGKVSCIHCKSQKLTAITGPGTKKGTDPKYFRRYQMVKVQEKITNASHISQTINVLLMDDLSDALTIGQEVIFNVVLLRKFPNKLIPNEIIYCTRYYLVVSVEIQTKDCNPRVHFTTEIEFKLFWHSYAKNTIVGRDFIVQSICPHLQGLYLPKLAVALLMAGGVEYRNQEIDVKVRGDIHILLIGDPGTGKSQLLNFAALIIDRSVMTTASHQTAAGLTVSSKQGPNNEWTIEAGVLVLANGGLCCIDEFEATSQNDRLVLLEAMEQQTISVAKTGFIGRLNSSCSILAAANPKGNRNDRMQSLRVNSGVYGPLLSRFDLVIPLYDNSSKQSNKALMAKDELMVEKVFQKYQNTIVIDDEMPSNLCAPLKQSHKVKKSQTIKMSSDRWDENKLRNYFKIIKKLKPVIKNEFVKNVLRKYFYKLRSSEIRDPDRTTIRLLESLIRLSEANAKLMFREEVTLVDAITAIILMETAMENAALFLPIDAFLCDFPEQPFKNLQQHGELILKELGFNDYKDELDKMNEWESHHNLY